MYRLRHAPAPGHTFPTRDPHLRLDYAFIPSAHKDRVIACDVVAHSRAVDASDHFAVVVELR